MCRRFVSGRWTVDGGRGMDEGIEERMGVFAI